MYHDQDFTGRVRTLEGVEEVTIAENIS
jgi:hypothetical protein